MKILNLSPTRTVSWRRIGTPHFKASPFAGSAPRGGVAALRRFFQSIPTDLGIAYVVIIDLSPDQPSSLSEILGLANRHARPPGQRHPDPEAGSGLCHRTGSATGP
ncbi:chemotaxis protein CheB [Paracoccus albicereus]|uniref:chemotaxis protein CheB n=1 Tax=Paracoccus albicereus TaxID=2922394 RepID=UPI00350E5A9F